MPLSTVIAAFGTGVCVRWRQVVPHCGQRQLLAYVLKESEQNVFLWDFGVSDIVLIVGTESEDFNGIAGSNGDFNEIQGCSSNAWTVGRFLHTQK